MSEAFFDSFYAGGAEYYGADARPEYNAFLASLPVNARLVDLACGQGRHAIPAARAGAVVHAIDYSEVAIEQLRAGAERAGLPITAECHDIRTVALEAAAYDAAVLVSTLSHFEANEIPGLVASIERALKPGASLFVEAFTTSDPGYSGDGSISETAAALHHFFKPGELQALLDHGFERLDYREFMEADLSHGPAHEHGVALFVGRRRRA